MKTGIAVAGLMLIVVGVGAIAFSRPRRRAVNEGRNFGKVAGGMIALGTLLLLVSTVKSH